ncbi:MAG: aminotransferase class I/II-fold pyridoxal phosphate-dependent enzyme [Akkermansia sp.]|nr:aminotransferase class I/II-fold pyridoxal phosphate-dependent enzyme [Akkermansia sp.]
MQAIILAAGMGKRLGELTKNNTKCMVQVNGVTLIERLLRQLDRVAETRGLSRIVIVVGYEGKKLQEYIATLGIKTPVEFVDNPIYDTTNNIYSLYLAKEQLQEDDTLLFESDLIFEDAVIDKLLDDPYPSLALVAKFESWMDGTVVTLDEEDNIRQFIPGKKFSYRHAEEYYKTVNIYKFGREFSRNYYVPFLAAYSSALGRNEYYEQVLRVITMLDKPEIKARRLDAEAWYEIDDVQDLDIAESIFCAPEERLPCTASRHGGYWRYPKMIDFSSFIHPYFPDGRLRSELRANFDRLLQGYPSGQAVNSLLAAKDYGLKREYVCVGNGASELIKAYLLEVPGKVGIALPAFGEYPNMLGEERLVAYPAGGHGFRYTAQDLIGFFSEHHVETLVVVNPDNPSGNALSRADMERLAEWTAQRGMRLLVDETFIEFTDAGAAASLLDNAALAANPHMAVVKSISKACGISGLRLGLLATADPALLAAVTGRLPLWNINSAAEFFLQIFGKYDKAYAAACTKLAAERKRFMQKMAAELPQLRLVPSEGNYFLAEVQAPHSAADIARRLLVEHNILIRHCGDKPGMPHASYLRIAVRSTEENDSLIRTLARIFAAR